MTVDKQDSNKVMIGTTSKKLLKKAKSDESNITNISFENVTDPDR